MSGRRGSGARGNLRPPVLSHRGLLIVPWLLMLAHAGCGGGASDAATPAERPPTPVQVEEVRPRELANVLTVPGIVEAKARIALGFRTDGFIEAFRVDEGDPVEAGQVIAALDLADLERDARMAEASLAQARARAAEAQLLFERHRDLLEAHNIAQQAFDQARLAADAARAEALNAELRLEAARDRLDKGVLRAPVDGYIERRLMEAHEPADTGAPVVMLTVLHPVTVRAAVADTALSLLERGATCYVRTPAWPERVFEGRITRVDVTADPATRTCPFEVEVPNEELLLRPELAVHVDVPLGEATMALTLPLAAILRDATGEAFCFVVEREEDEVDRAGRRPVTLGHVHEDRTTITAGLAAGDRVITRGQHFLGDGDPVRILGP